MGYVGSSPCPGSGEMLAEVPKPISAQVPTTFCLAERTVRAQGHQETELLCPPAWGGSRQEAELQTPRPSQAKLPCNRQWGPLRLQQPLPTPAFIFSAQTQISQDIKTSLPFPGSPMSPGGDIPPKKRTGCTEQGRAGPLGPPPPDFGGPSPHCHGRMLMLQPSFDLLPTDRGDWKREQFLLWQLLPSLVPCCKPSQSPTDSTQTLQPFFLPPLGPGRAEQTCKIPPGERKQESMAHGCPLAPCPLMFSPGTTGI